MINDSSLLLIHFYAAAARPRLLLTLGGTKTDVSSILFSFSVWDFFRKPNRQIRRHGCKKVEQFCTSFVLLIKLCLNRWLH